VLLGELLALLGALETLADRVGYTQITSSVACSESNRPVARVATVRLGDEYGLKSARIRRFRGRLEQNECQPGDSYSSRSRVNVPTRSSACVRMTYGPVAQWESVRFTRGRSLVRSQPGPQKSTEGVPDHRGRLQSFESTAV